MMVIAPDAATHAIMGAIDPAALPITTLYGVEGFKNNV